MAKLSVTDPTTLHGVVSALGGRVIDGPTFKFELPQEEVREVVPKLNSTRPQMRARRRSRQQSSDGKSIVNALM